VLYAVKLSTKTTPRFIKVGRTDNLAKRLASYRGAAWDVELLGIGFGGVDEEAFLLKLLTALSPPVKGREFFDPTSLVEMVVSGALFNYSTLDSLWGQMEWDIGCLHSAGHPEIAQKVSGIQGSCEALRDCFADRNGTVKISDDMGQLVAELHFY
jgi:hypothetical protein